VDANFAYVDAVNDTPLPLAIQYGSSPAGLPVDLCCRTASITGTLSQTPADTKRYASTAMRKLNPIQQFILQYSSEISSGTLDRRRRHSLSHIKQSASGVDRDRFQKIGRKN
jgi:hypothetical protein